MARARTASAGDDQARAVIERLQRFGRDHPTLTDTAIAAGVALIGVPSLRHHQQWGIALTVALCAAAGAAAPLPAIGLRRDRAGAAGAVAARRPAGRGPGAAGRALHRCGGLVAAVDGGGGGRGGGRRRAGDAALGRSRAAVLRRPLGAGARIGPARHQRPEPAGAAGLAAGAGRAARARARPAGPSRRRRRARPDRAGDARHRRPQPGRDDRARRRGRVRRPRVPGAGHGGDGERCPAPAARRWPRCGGCWACCTRTSAGSRVPQPGIPELDAAGRRRCARRACRSSSRSTAIPPACPLASSWPPTGSCRRRSPTRSSTPGPAPPPTCACCA